MESKLGLFIYCMFLGVVILLIASFAEAKVVSVWRATGSGAMSETYTLTDLASEGKLSEVRLHLSAASATSENFTIFNDADTGTQYDIVLFAQDMDTVQDLVYLPVRPQFLVSKDDVLTFTWTNSDARTWGLELIFDDGR